VGEPELLQDINQSHFYEGITKARYYFTGCLWAVKVTCCTERTFINGAFNDNQITSTHSVDWQGDNECGVTIFMATDTGARVRFQALPERKT
jgi:hypothetical protein